MIGGGAAFLDRREAGRALAERVMRFAGEHPVVLALPRGGVPVAFEVAQALGAPLDLLFVRKIGAPGHPEYGIGAVVDGDNPQLVLNEAVELLGIPPSYIEQQMARELKTIEERREAYMGDRAPVPVEGRTVLVVDDGIATGGTMKASLKALRAAGARKIVVAVPVAPADTIAELRALADDVICLAVPGPFYAVGMHYRDFTQTSDGEVIRLLDEARRREPARAG